MKKYIIFAILIICVGVGLVACKGKSDETEISAGTAASEQQSSDYQKLSILIPDHIMAKDFVLTETDIVLLDGNGITRINYDGVIYEEIMLPGSESFARLSIDERGHFNILALSHNDEGNIESLTVHCFHSSGSVWKPRTELKGSFAELDDTPFIGDFLTANGYYYVQTMYHVFVYDTKGELILTVGEEHGIFTNSLFLMEDGRVASVSTGERNNTNLLFVRIYEPETANFTEYIINIKASSPSTINLFGGGFGLLMVENAEILEYALETGRGDVMLNFPNNGVDSAMLIGISHTRDGDIVCVLARDSAMMLGRTAGEVAIFSTSPDHVRGTMEAHRPGEETNIVAGPPKEKETVTIMFMESDGFWKEDWLRDRVNWFNKANPDYHVEVRAYTFTDASDIDDARRRFTIDLAHDPADIIYLSSGWSGTVVPVPIRSHARKGVFADLYEIMDNDPDFNKDEYLPNIFKALETDGRLYDIAAGVTIEFIIGKASDFAAGEKPGWTIDEFAAFLNTKPEAEYIIESFTKESFITTMIEYYFTDRETGEVKFDREAFHKILEVSDRFPVTGPVFEDGDGLLGSDKWFYWQSGAKDGDPLLLHGSMHGDWGFRDMMTAEVVHFGEDIIFKGFPSAEGTGIQFRIPQRFAISEKSSQKDGAWEFIKFTMEVQFIWNINNTYGEFYHIFIPIKIESIEEMLDKALKNPMMADDKSPYYVSLGGLFGIPRTRIDVGNNTPEMNKKIMDLIKSTTVVVPSDQVVRRIINEELASYLAGQKTPDQVADIIENRVGVYLAELD